jgi:antitoxin component YwqK of YwqJK toxin-antitoxin module
MVEYFINYYLKKSYVFILIVAICTLSCNISTNNKSAKLDKEAKSYLGRNILINKNLIISYKDEKYKVKDFYQSNNKKLVFISYNQCQCINTLTKWYQFMSEENVSKNYDYYFIVSGMTLQELRSNKVISEAINNLPIIVDNDKWMEINNKLPESIVLNTMILDENNNIEVIGDPFINKEMEELYKKYLISIR